MNRVFSGSCEAAREELDAGEEDPGLGGLDGRLEVLGQPPFSIEPGERALDDPSAGQELEARSTLLFFRFSMTSSRGQTGPRFNHSAASHAGSRWLSANIAFLASSSMRQFMSLVVQPNMSDDNARIISL